MTPSTQVSRRAFLQGTAAAGGALVLGFYLPRKGLEAATAQSSVNAWLRIGTDNRVTIIVANSEMGQGVTTSLPMLVAEEAEVDWKKVGFEMAPANPAYNNPLFGMQGTGGSTSVRGSFKHLREAGAAAREMLRQAAANRWNVPVEETVANDSVVSHAKSGRKATYGELASDASKLTPPKDVPLKDPKRWELLGKPMARLDVPAKVNGTAEFGMDVKVPGMLVGTVMACPVFGGKLKGTNEAAAKAVKGVKAIVPLPDAVIVVADTYWNAKRGMDALKPEWDLGENAGRQENSNRSELQSALEEPGNPAQSEGDAAAAISGAAKRIEAQYQFPFLNHATMEPMNATAKVTADGAEIWAPTQAQGPAQVVVSKVLGITPDKVKVHTTYLGGGFGRRFELDFILHAVFAAKATGAPVHVIWSREEDMRHGFYRPGMAVRVAGGLDASGKAVGFQAKVAGPSIMSRVFPQFVKNGIDHTSVEGIAHTPYHFGAIRVDYVRKEVGVPVGFWRSVGNSFTAFTMETFVDELAQAAGKDPVAFRRELLAQKPRFLAVLNKAAEAGKWGQPLPKGRARGIAIHESFGSIVAEVAEVSLEGTAVRVHHVATAVDCGRVINPNTVVAQMESGIIYGLTAAYFGENTVANGSIVQSNFTDYPMLKMNQTPTVDVHILESGEALGGIGEPATPPIAPAVGNALAVLTGKRLRSLPLVKHGYTIA